MLQHYHKLQKDAQHCKEMLTKHTANNAMHKTNTELSQPQRLEDMRLHKTTAATKKQNGYKQTQSSYKERHGIQ